MKKRRIICMGLCLALCGCWWTLSKEKLLDRLDQVQQQLQDLEVLINADDDAGNELLDDCKKRLENVPDLIVENELERADRVIEQVALRVDRFAKKLNRPRDSLVKPIVVLGEAEYQAGDGGGMRALTEGEAPEDLQRIRTDIRSAVLLRPFPNLTLHLAAQSDLRLDDFDKQENALRLSLQKGALSLSKSKGRGRIMLEMGELQATAKGRFDLQMVRDVITETGYVAVYDGNLSWHEGAKKGKLGKYTGLLWRDNAFTRVDIPVRPTLDAPLDYQTLVVPHGNEAEISFRWHFPLQVDQYQIQISEHPLFVTRVHDRTDAADSSVSVSLAPGTYYWRVRGLSWENVAGPFSPASRLTVKQGAAEAPKALEKQRGEPEKGPTIVGLEFEIINDMVIVSGRTFADARVTVNGASAVMMDNGAFRAVLTFSTEGEHDIRVIATNARTGAETIQERKVKIQF